jgi:hypothetical protein
LVDLLKSEDENIPESTHRSAAVALCDLIQSHDDRKIHILDIGVLGPLKRILTSNSIRNNELKYWSLMVLHQVSLSGMEVIPIIFCSVVCGSLIKLTYRTFSPTIDYQWVRCGISKNGTHDIWKHKYAKILYAEFSTRYCKCGSNRCLPYETEIYEMKGTLLITSHI